MRIALWTTSSLILLMVAGCAPKQEETGSPPKCSVSFDESPAAVAKRVVQLRDEIAVIEAQCVPARGTLRADVEERFGAGRAAANSKIPPREGIPDDSPHRSYPFCDNGVLFVAYDDHWRVLWAHYLNPYSNKGRPATGSVGRSTSEDELRELELRLRQITAIRQEYDKRFPTEISWERAKSLIASGRITSVSQNHKLVVGLVDRDGTRYTTKEPAIDDVLKLVDQADPKRERIQFITE